MFFNTAVVAPIPRARVATAMIVKVEFFRRMREANFRF
jgi:hypothetical protein